MLFFSADESAKRILVLINKVLGENPYMIIANRYDLKIIYHLQGSHPYIYPFL